MLKMLDFFPFHRFIIRQNKHDEERGGCCCIAFLAVVQRTEQSCTVGGSRFFSETAILVHGASKL